MPEASLPPMWKALRLAGLVAGADDVDRNAQPAQTLL
jgi:hypothetical protein